MPNVSKRKKPQSAALHYYFRDMIAHSIVLIKIKHIYSFEATLMKTY